MSCSCLFRCSGRQPLMLCPWTRDLALAPGAKLCTYRRCFFSSCTSGLPSLLGSPHEHCKVAEDFEISHAMRPGLICCQLSRAAICACPCVVLLHENVFVAGHWAPFGGHDGFTHVFQGLLWEPAGPFCHG